MVVGLEDWNQRVRPKAASGGRLNIWLGLLFPQLRFQCPRSDLLDHFFWHFLSRGTSHRRTGS